MREENKKIKYSVGPSSEDYENPADSVSFEVSTKDPNDTSRITSGISYRRHFGSHIPFSWRGNEPRFTVGPHCNISVFVHIIILLRAFLYMHVDNFDCCRISCDWVCYLEGICHFNILDIFFDDLEFIYISVYSLKESWYSKR